MDLSDFSVAAESDYTGTVDHELWCNRSGCDGIGVILTLDNIQDLPTIITTAEEHAKQYHGE